MKYELQLPSSALVEKFIPKERFYERSVVNTKIRDEFQNKVKRITWKYKLSEETIGVDRTEEVEEIQIFEVELKEKLIPTKVLNLINRLIPYPILFIFIFDDNFAYGVSLIDDKETYYFSEWDKEIDFEFNGLDLKRVYENIVSEFITKVEKKDQEFDKLIEIDKNIKSVEHEIEVLKSKIKNENQFNRKVELNRLLHNKEDEYRELQEKS